jgi:hypothetical protein
MVYLWSTNHIHDIVIELQQPNASKEINMHIEIKIGYILSIVSWFSGD